MLTLPTGITVSVFIASASAFIAAAVLLPLAARRYHQHMEGTVGVALRAQFIAMPTSRLLLIAGLSGLCLAALGAVFLPWPLALGLGVGGLAAPNMLVSALRQRRQRALIRQLPDALQALASSLRAGSNLGRGLELVSRRQPRPLVRRSRFTGVAAVRQPSVATSSQQHDAVWIQR